MPLQRRTALAALAALACLPPALALPGCAAPPPAGPRDWFVFLESGAPTPDDREAVMRMQRGHIDNFKRLFGEGRLSAAGPLADPQGVKRGIVVVRAASLAELRSFFDADDYVRLGHMTLNAQPATVHRALHTEGIDATRVEELRIALLPRLPGAARDIDHPLLAALVERGHFGAWYTLEQGPVAEVLFARSTSTPAVQAALAALPAVASGRLQPQVWSQWLSPGVLR